MISYLPRIPLLIWAAVVITTSVAAQTVAIPPGTPACLISCLTASCPTLDFTCICVTEINGITNCATSNCSESTLGTAATVGQEICTGCYHLEVANLYQVPQRNLSVQHLLLVQRHLSRQRSILLAPPQRARHSRVFTPLLVRHLLYCSLHFQSRYFIYFDGNSHSNCLLLNDLVISRCLADWCFNWLCRSILPHNACATRWRRAFRKHNRRDCWRDTWWSIAFLHYCPVLSAGKPKQELDGRPNSPAERGR